MSADKLNANVPWSHYYGLTVINPTMQAKIIMPPMTWLDVLRSALWEIWWCASQAFLLAAAITAFRIAFS